MSTFRKAAILSLNAAVAAWLLKVIFFDEGSDVVGIFFIVTLLFLLFFNAYAFTLAKLLFRNDRLFYTELLFSILLLLPFFLLWRVF